MIFGIVLCVVVHIIFTVVVISRAFNITLAPEITPLFLSFAVFGTLLSICAVMMNYANMKQYKKPHNVVGFVFSLVALVLFICYILHWYVTSLHAQGISVF